jgi:hypothetical protein
MYVVYTHIYVFINTHTYIQDYHQNPRTQNVEHVDGGVLAGDVQHGDVEVDADLS